VWARVCRISTVAGLRQNRYACRNTIDAIESLGKPVTPASLYFQQLRDRLGDSALRNIGHAK